MEFSKNEVWLLQKAVERRLKDFYPARLGSESIRLKRLRSKLIEEYRRLADAKP